MAELNFDFSCARGKIKQMNCLNNGPARRSVRGHSNFEEYKALEIPYARNHDAAFFTCYGGEHTVDVHRIFKNFDADENDPANYIFEPTDNYTATIFDAGTKVFYRLGATIEHEYKFGTRVPKDFSKWARIAEHIIRHYTEGWADGFYYDIEYWEIWNEPEVHDPDGTTPCWQGTMDQFTDFFEVVAKHLKKCFPHLKIGGPSFTTAIKHERFTKFLAAVKDRNIPLDFYSFHGYFSDVRHVRELSRNAVEQFEEAGLPQPELIFNEWNYARGWMGDVFDYSREQSRKIKGASFCAAVMCLGQSSDIDMMMYYDARPSEWCGLFNVYDYRVFKPYYSFAMFRDVKSLGGHVDAESESGNIFAVASTDGRDGAILLTHYDDDDGTQPERVTLNVNKKAGDKGTRVEFYLLDNEHNYELVRAETFDRDSFSLLLEMKLFDTYLVKLVSL